MIKDGEFGYERLNITVQSRDPDSLLNRMRQIIGTRRGAPEFGWGDFRLIEVDTPAVMAHRCDWRGNAVLALHNLSRRPCEATLKLGAQQFKELTDILTDRHYPALGPEDRRIPLSGYGLPLAAPRRHAPLIRSPLRKVGAPALHRAASPTRRDPCSSAGRVLRAWEPAEWQPVGEQAPGPEKKPLVVGERGSLRRVDANAARARSGTTLLPWGSS